MESGVDSRVIHKGGFFIEVCRTRIYIYTPMEQIIYTDLQALIEMYKVGDLPDQMAYTYYIKPGHPAHIHIDELKRAVMMENIYPAANNQRGK